MTPSIASRQMSQKFYSGIYLNLKGVEHRVQLIGVLQCGSIFHRALLQIWKETELCCRHEKNSWLRVMRAHKNWSCLNWEVSYFYTLFLRRREAASLPPWVSSVFTVALVKRVASNVELPDSHSNCQLQSMPIVFWVTVCVFACLSRYVFVHACTCMCLRGFRVSLKLHGLHGCLTLSSCSASLGPSGWKVLIQICAMEADRGKGCTVCLSSVHTAASPTAHFLIILQRSSEIFPSCAWFDLCLLQATFGSSYPSVTCCHISQFWPSCSCICGGAQMLWSHSLKL